FNFASSTSSSFQSSVVAQPSLMLNNQHSHSTTSSVDSIKSAIPAPQPIEPTLQQQSPQKSSVAQAAVVSEQQPSIAASEAHYNGFDPKIVPEVQDKIRMLIDRLKFLNTN